MWDYQTLYFWAKKRFLAKQISPQNSRQLNSEEMAARKANRTAAIALCWNASSVTVRCPFCQKPHTHRISFFARDCVSGHLKTDSRGRFKYYGPSNDRCESRGAHCNNDIPITLEYTILFPFENDPRVAGFSFEIESLPTNQPVEFSSHNQRFRSIGPGLEPIPLFRTSQTPLNLERNGEQELILRMRDMEITQHKSTSFREDLATHAKEGNLPKIRHIITSSSEPTELANTRGPNGSSLLALATQSGHVSTVKYLLKHGGDVNSSDHLGRTPLMEAALWGNAQIVYLLLQQGADRHRRDRNDLRAHDFATESDRNDKERSERHTRYLEDPSVMKGQRMLIRSLLGQETSKRSMNTFVVEDLPDTHFYKSSDAGTISLVVPAWGTPIATQNKTLAILNRGGPFPLLQAISGGKGRGHEEFNHSLADFETLDAKYWLPVAIKIASTIGFSFKPHPYDKNLRLSGGYYASHAEIQLMCFFIRRNYIFREYEPEETVEDDFLQLFLLQERNQHSEIIISSPPCDSCNAFAKKVLDTLGITFKLSPLDECRKFRCPGCDEEWQGRAGQKKVYYCIYCGKSYESWKIRP
jgi:hypothetical protein